MRPKLLPLGVDLDTFHPRRFDAEVRARHAREDEVLVVMASRLSAEKRPGTALDAVAELRARGVRVRLVVVGDGPLAPALRRRAESLPVSFAGFLGSRPELAGLLAVADVVLAPGPIETFGLAALEALAAIAHDAGALLSVDSTFTPPPLYRPLADGADLVVHSLTKYINGHGDAMGGAVIGRRELIHQIKADAMVDVGGVISPFNAWLIVRGSITLPLRLARHLESAQAVAEFLAADPRIAFVAYPGLPSHPQHEVAARQFGGRGYGAMLAFALDGPPELQNRFVAELRVITSAVSLGHDESLIVHIGNEGPKIAAYSEPFRRYGLLRLSIGLEDPADLIADISQALDKTAG